MNYDIWRVFEDGRTQQLGTTRYEEDAKSILKNWAQGYITHNGSIIFQKGVKL